MTRRSPVLVLGLLAGLTAAAAAGAEGPHEWLARVAAAARGVNYEGIFVYLHEGQLEAMRIVHRVDGGRVQERLVALNGAPREIVRNEREVICYLPAARAATVEQRQSDRTAFPSIPPERLADIEAYYELSLGASGRVAGREARQLVIRPRDEYRYGYELWVDGDTGVLLQADLIDAGGRPLERFMFTQIAIGGTIPAEALKPETDARGLTWHRRAAPPLPASAAGSWHATQLPDGFRLSARIARQPPARPAPVEHLVYSDGLATVSVFIEKLAAGAAPALVGASRAGALNAYGTRVGEYQVTAVGEVPAAAVARIGGSVTRGP